MSVDVDRMKSELFVLPPISDCLTTSLLLFTLVILTLPPSLLLTSFPRFPPPQEEEEGEEEVKKKQQWRTIKDLQEERKERKGERQDNTDRLPY